MLIFFDVDATLITTSRSGILAMESVGRYLFGSRFTTDRTEFAGRLDPLILMDLLRSNDLEVSEANLRAMREGYRRSLAERLKEPGIAAALPGVMSLLEALEATEGIILGLLTGNYPDTGALKLRACGIDPERFAIQVWGDQSPHVPPCRTHLPAVGMERYRERHGQIEGSRVVVIGDTPHDIACALANGCRSLGVATGSYSEDDLRSAGADLVVPDLSRTVDVVRWLVG
jgi:phosphoglycolate phosphatase